MIFIKPLDEKKLHSICKKYNTIITVEDGCLQGGFGSSILEFVSENRYSNQVHRLGIPDKFIDHGTQEELWAECGINSTAIVKEVESIINKSQISQAG